MQMLGERRGGAVVRSWKEGEGMSGKKRGDVGEGTEQIRIGQGWAMSCVTGRINERRKWKRAERGGWSTAG